MGRGGARALPIPGAAQRGPLSGGGAWVRLPGEVYRVVSAALPVGSIVPSGSQHCPLHTSATSRSGGTGPRCRCLSCHSLGQGAAAPIGWQIPGAPLAVSSFPYHVGNPAPHFSEGLQTPPDANSSKIPERCYGRIPSAVGSPRSNPSPATAAC